MLEQTDSPADGQTDRQAMLKETRWLGSMFWC